MLLTLSLLLIQGLFAACLVLIDTLLNAATNNVSNCDLWIKPLVNDIFSPVLVGPTEVMDIESKTSLHMAKGNDDCQAIVHASRLYRRLKNKTYNGLHLFFYFLTLF